MQLNLDVLPAEYHPVGQPAWRVQEALDSNDFGAHAGSYGHHLMGHYPIKLSADLHESHKNTIVPPMVKLPLT